MAFSLGFHKASVAVQSSSLGRSLTAQGLGSVVCLINPLEEGSGLPASTDWDSDLELDFSGLVR